MGVCGLFFLPDHFPQCRKSIADSARFVDEADFLRFRAFDDGSDVRGDLIGAQQEGIELFAGDFGMTAENASTTACV